MRRMVRIGKLLFDDWESLALSGGWSDTFIFQMSPTVGLPPADYAKLVRLLVPKVMKLRKSASLWVQISSKSEQGTWFAQAVRRALHGSPAPVAVTCNCVRPQIQDFSFLPWVDRSPLPQPPAAAPYLKGEDLRLSALSRLRTLARADCAHTREVASLVGLSLPTVRKDLRALEESGHVQLVTSGKYPY